MVFKAERLGCRSLGASSARRRRRRRLRSALPWCYRSYPVSVVSSTASSLSGTSSLSSTSSSSGMSSSLVRTWYSIRGGARSTAAGICAVVLPVRLRFWGRSSGSCCLNGAQKRLRLERCLDGPFRSLNSLRVSRTQVLHRGLCLSSVILVHTHTGFVLHARAFPPLALYSTAVTMHVVPSVIARRSPIRASSVSYRTSCCVAGLLVSPLIGVLGVRGLCVVVCAVDAVGELGGAVDLGIVSLRVRRSVGDFGLRVVP